MSTRLPAAALGSIVLALTLTACGSSADADGAGDPATNSDPSGSSSPAPDGQREKITPGAVALIAMDHLGDKVRRVSTFGSEPGSVSVMIELRDTTRHNFSLSVYSPENAEGAVGGKAGTCPPKAQRGQGSCQVLDSGTTVMSDRTPYGFSDDNANGVVLFGSSMTRDNGSGMVMYESYDKTPTVDQTEIEDLLADERLGWLTDPEVIEAGEDVTVTKRMG